MSGFTYREGALAIENVALQEIAESVGTPCYVYSLDQIRETYRAFEAALVDALGKDRALRICYAVKANGNLAVLRSLACIGAGADVVSAGELERALAAGIPASSIVFAGVGKTRRDQIAGLKAGILQFNIESLPELQALDRVAGELGVKASVALRINPDVDARTHEKISTGRAEDKFGIDIDLAPQILAQAANLANISVEGLAVHIGSQLTEVEPFERAFTRVAELYRALRAEGMELLRLDLGGGLGIAYHPGQATIAPAEYASAVARTLGDLDVGLVFEPGRFLVANAGALLSEVTYVKAGRERRFAILDAAMNDLLRPALYDAHHEILPLRQPQSEGAREAFDVVGPVCETADTFARGRELPVLSAGDRVAIMSAGAYGAVMASTYNGRALPTEVVVQGDRWAVARPAIPESELLARESLPDWLDEPGTVAQTQRA